MAHDSHGANFSNTYGKHFRLLIDPAYCFYTIKGSRRFFIPKNGCTKLQTLFCGFSFCNVCWKQMTATIMFCCNTSVKSSQACSQVEGWNHVTSPRIVLLPFSLLKISLVNSLCLQRYRYQYFKLFPS